MTTEQTNGGRDEAFDQLMDLAAEYFEASRATDSHLIKEKICSFTFDRIKVLEEALERNKSTAETALRV